MSLRRAMAHRAAASMLAALPLLLTGCAAVVVQQNLAETNAFAVREVGAQTRLLLAADERLAALARTRALLAGPLAIDDAVRIALEFSPAFQRLLADSAAASAAVTQSARMTNPTLGYSRLAAGGASQIDSALAFSLLDLLLLPERRKLADMQQFQHRLRSAGDVITTATATRQAWIHAVAARQSLSYAERAQQAAAAAAELGRRMAAAGNFSRIESAREQVFYAEATADLARAQLEARHTREDLIRQLGLPTDLASMLRVPDRLPDLPKVPEDESVLARREFESRLDVALARAELDFTARSLGLTRVTSMVNALDVTAGTTHDSGAETLRGFGVNVQLPLFDFGDARRANAQAVYVAAMNHVAAVIVEAQSQLRQSFFEYQTAYSLATHYRDQVVPLQKTIADEDLLRYNGMLISVFELLADARQQIIGVRQAIGAQRDFWLADAALHAALIGRPVEGLTLGLPVVEAGAGAAQPH